jgi:CBS domain-containing protein
MTLKQLLTRQVDTARRDETAWQAAERMHQHAVGALVVVDAENLVVGILTDRDLVERVMATNRDARTTKVEQVMTRSPVTVNADAPLESVLARMKQGRFRRVPVVDDSDRLVGLVTMDDILMWLARQLDMIARLVEHETPQAAARS